MDKPSELEIETMRAICGTAALLNSPAALSRRQSAIVALVLNRFDWLWDLDLSMVQAIGLVGVDGVALVIEVERRYYRDIDT